MIALSSSETSVSLLLMSLGTSVSLELALLQLPQCMASSSVKKPGIHTKEEKITQRLTLPFDKCFGNQKRSFSFECSRPSWTKGVKLRGKVAGLCWQCAIDESENLPKFVATSNSHQNLVTILRINSPISHVAEAREYMHKYKYISHSVLMPRKCLSSMIHKVFLLGRKT